MLNLIRFSPTLFISSVSIITGISTVIGGFSQSLFSPILLTQNSDYSVINDRISINEPNTSQQDIPLLISPLAELPNVYTPPTKTQPTSQSNSPSSIEQNSNPVVHSNTITPQQNPSKPNSITIPSINLINTPYVFGSLQNISDIETKLTYGPVIDIGYNSEPCLPNSSTYMMGHSEPAYSWQSNHSGSYVFNRLHTVKVGEIITVTNSQSLTCTYIVEGWETVTTVNDEVDQGTFNRLIFPDTSSGSILSIQTCQLGSATVRLILKARMVQ